MQMVDAWLNTQVNSMGRVKTQEGPSPPGPFGPDTRAKSVDNIPFLYPDLLDSDNLTVPLSATPGEAGADNSFDLLRSDSVENDVGDFVEQDLDGFEENVWDRDDSSEAPSPYLDLPELAFLEKEKDHQQQQQQQQQQRLEDKYIPANDQPEQLPLSWLTARNASVTDRVRFGVVLDMSNRTIVIKGRRTELQGIDFRNPGREVLRLVSQANVEIRHCRFVTQRPSAVVRFVPERLRPRGCVAALHVFDSVDFVWASSSFRGEEPSLVTIKIDGPSYGCRQVFHNVAFRCGSAWTSSEMGVEDAQGARVVSGSPSDALDKRGGLFPETFKKLSDPTSFQCPVQGISVMYNDRCQGCTVLLKRSAFWNLQRGGFEMLHKGDMEGSSLHVSDSLFRGATELPALRVRFEAPVHLSRVAVVRSLFADNQMLRDLPETREGAAVRVMFHKIVESTRVDLRDSTFIRNSATGAGGAVAVWAPRARSPGRMDASMTGGIAAVGQQVWNPERAGIAKKVKKMVAAAGPCGPEVEASAHDLANGRKFLSAPFVRRSKTAGGSSREDDSESLDSLFDWSFLKTRSKVRGSGGDGKEEQSHSRELFDLSQDTHGEEQMIPQRTKTGFVSDSPPEAWVKEAHGKLKRPPLRRHLSFDLPFGGADEGALGRIDHFVSLLCSSSMMLCVKNSTMVENSAGSCSFHKTLKTVGSRVDDLVDHQKVPPLRGDDELEDQGGASSSTVPQKLKGAGGALWASGATVVLSESKLGSNCARLYGGAMALAGPPAACIVDHSMLENNTCDMAGLAFFSEGPTALFLRNQTTVGQMDPRLGGRVPMLDTGRGETVHGSGKEGKRMSLSLGGHLFSLLRRPPESVQTLQRAARFVEEEWLRGQSMTTKTKEDSPVKPRRLFGDVRTSAQSLQRVALSENALIFCPASSELVVGTADREQIGCHACSAGSYSLEGVPILPNVYIGECLECADGARCFELPGLESQRNLQKGVAGVEPLIGLPRHRAYANANSNANMGTDHLNLSGGSGDVPFTPRFTSSFEEDSRTDGVGVLLQESDGGGPFVPSVGSSPTFKAEEYADREKLENGDEGKTAKQEEEIYSDNWKLIPWDFSCTGNRQGVLCGECEEGTSAAVWSPECVENSSCRLTFQIIFFLVCIVLAAFILFLIRVWDYGSTGIFKTFIFFVQVYGQALPVLILWHSSALSGFLDLTGLPFYSAPASLTVLAPMLRFLCVGPDRSSADRLRFSLVPPAVCFAVWSLVASAHLLCLWLWETLIEKKARKVAASGGKQQKKIRWASFTERRQTETRSIPKPKITDEEAPHPKCYPSLDDAPGGVKRNQTSPSAAHSDLPSSDPQEAPRRRRSSQDIGRAVVERQQRREQEEGLRGSKGGRCRSSLWGGESITARLARSRIQRASVVSASLEMESEEDEKRRVSGDAEFFFLASLAAQEGEEGADRQETREDEGNRRMRRTLRASLQLDAGLPPKGGGRNRGVSFALPSVARESSGSINEVAVLLQAQAASDKRRRQNEKARRRYTFFVGRLSSSGSSSGEAMESDWEDSEVEKEATQRRASIWGNWNWSREDRRDSSGFVEAQEDFISFAQATVSSHVPSRRASRKGLGGRGSFLGPRGGSESSAEIGGGDEKRKEEGGEKGIGGPPASSAERRLTVVRGRKGTGAGGLRDEAWHRSRRRMLGVSKKVYEQCMAVLEEEKEKTKSRRGAETGSHFVHLDSLFVEQAREEGKPFSRHFRSLVEMRAAQYLGVLASLFSVLYVPIFHSSLLMLQCLTVPESASVVYNNGETRLRIEYAWVVLRAGSQACDDWTYLSLPICLLTALLVPLTLVWATRKSRTMRKILYEAWLVTRRVLFVTIAVGVEVLLPSTIASMSLVVILAFSSPIGTSFRDVLPLRVVFGCCVQNVTIALFLELLLVVAVFAYILWLLLDLAATR
uniref:Transmembrane protein n=1 Tax=Chromera velia CCMP2878 TaxID=1169474 RepID=A0A0G4FBC9_9ALVE|eukprot:Cvel_16045.t1-p1 / transcript=Cvel_16045.t1 / gene=Cvel_16045 / organism=Chromera_velia_CCMP2878 / gene_product=hypothetical protein / transcript_product=hypothetical protein / location=Cvel_scaffold1219:6842-18332(+) / protein_length=1941 / sequence_SO=supercontig / SO=protein_coding / is_pseudo=false